MRPPNFEQELTTLIRRAKMKFEPRAKEDLLNALNNFTDLQPDFVNFVFPDGISKWCLSISGTIPILYKGARYNIPVALHFLDNHPFSGPYCYVKPTSNMRIRASKVVDDTGRIYLPYLTEWKYPNHDTTGLLQVITIEFQEKCPVYSTTNAPKTTNSYHQKSATASNPPYPSAGTNSNPPYHSSALPYPTTDPPSHLMPQPSSYTPMPHPGFQSPYPNSYSSDSASPYATPMPTAMPQQNNNYSYGTGTIQPTHIRASLLSAVEDRIRQKLRDKIGTPFAELQSIDINLQELNKGKQTLRDMLGNIARDQQELDRILAIYTEKKTELEKALKAANVNGTTNGSTVNVEEAIDAQTPVHRQILKCYVQDCAVDDTIYHLSQALRQGVINLQTYLKYVRQLSHQQFQYRLLMHKCRERARLPI